MGKIGFSGASLLLHLIPLALAFYIGEALRLDPAELEFARRPSSPLELSLLRREPDLDFKKPVLNPAVLAEPEAPLEFQKPPLEPAQEALPAPPPLKGSAPAPSPLERPLRVTTELLSKLPAPAPAESIPSVESETLPLQIHNPPPEYPLAARRQRLEGVVVVEVTVLEDGRCGGARLIQDCDVPLFSASALEAVRKWTFQPATRGGKPVRSLERIRFVFKLTNR